MAEQKSFYITFMQKQAFKRSYVEIIADNEEQARQCAFDHFGDKFFTSYSDDEAMQEQVLEFNLKRLALIRVTDYGSSVEYTLEGQD